MVLQGPPAPLGGGQPVPPSLLRANSGILGGQGGGMPSQNGFPSLASPRNQFNSMNMNGNVPNVSSLLHQSFGNGAPSSGLSGHGGVQRGLSNGRAESDPLSSVGNGIGFNQSSSSFMSSAIVSNSNGQVQGQQQFSNLTDQQAQQLDPQNFQHNQHQLQQFSVPSNPQQQAQQHQFQTMQAGVGGAGSIKMEPQVNNEQAPQQLQALHNLGSVKLESQQLQPMRGLGPVKMEPQQAESSMFLLQQQQQQQQQAQQHQFQTMQAGVGGAGSIKMEPQVNNEQAPQQLQALHNLGSVKLESQQLQPMRGLGPVKMEPQQAEPSMFLLQQQQQQQQQRLLLSRQSSQVAAAAAAQILQQQRLMQQQLLKSMPQQRPLLQPQFQHQNMPVGSPVKPVYEPGMCARRLTHYMYHQQHRPEDNNIEFWRKFVAEYFAPNANKKWCVSMYGNGRQTNGVFPQDVWHCEICNRKPGRGFEATAEVLPRLFKIKYESGTLEELLYVDMPREYQNFSGQIVLDYAKAIQESVFEQLRVVRDGQLRIVFSPDLKICSWEFCARRHEELIPRRFLSPQVSQLGATAQKFQAATSNASSSAPISELQNNCNTFVASARHLAKALEVPLVNDLGYTKRYVRCLQISEVVNSMKILIDYSHETGTGPMESLAKFSQRTKPGFLQDQPQQNESQLQQQQQTMVQNSSNPAQAAVMQLAESNGMRSTSNTTNSVPATSTSAMTGLFHQNSINSRHQNPISSANSPCGGNSIHMPSPDYSTTIPQTQPASSPFQSPTPSSSNNPLPAPHGGSSGVPVNSINSPNVSIQQTSVSGDADANDSQSSVQKIIHDMMMSAQLGSTGTMGMGAMNGNMKKANGMMSANNGAAMNGIRSLANGNHGSGGSGFGSISNGHGHGQSTVTNGVHGSTTLSMNGRVSRQQDDLGNQLLNGLGTVNGFNDLQFEWKSSP